MFTGLIVPFTIFNGPAEATPIPLSTPFSEAMKSLAASAIFPQSFKPSPHLVETSIFCLTLKSSPIVAIATLVAPTSTPSA